ncbi:uncharacterized protein PADG_11153 [Paracoccidioides brasiliensis Pb18]|uniref:Uncharacterized protein n=2 Tax=Paracoccidioides brasiliensis TaxID=121759 RepID=A0A0A0HXA8_PARBD|nr:uncharacterized protein PADG_11153 [Paracoccidioides brasiliensis Pb18]KGM92696.1 hypothetical protein PADG_11153 [Paracoccidioides brasiliensis Pb18]ODH38788.1 hypothetical protein ACO22_02188 [Paracoccidioides brasiliensis]ODH49482.1 hypothetical protein GX48_04424 [Paracoccidioides brasiliensis]
MNHSEKLRLASACKMLISHDIRGGAKSSQTPIAVPSSPLVHLDRDVMVTFKIAREICNFEDHTA